MDDVELAKTLLDTRRFNAWTVQDDVTLVCPDGHAIEWDGTCPDGLVSPLVEMGVI